MKWSSRSTKILQISFFGLFVICIAQVTYWVLEQVHFTSEAHNRILSHYADDLQTAGMLLEAGTSQARMRELFPDIAFDDDGEPVLRADVLADLENDRRSRINRYGWEGTFFLIVLVAGIAVIWQVLRQRADLLHRQQNFLAAVTHEFKSPLASLRLSAETLTVRRPDDGTLERVSERLVTDVRRLEILVSKILDAARIDSGATIGAPESVELAPEVLRMVEQEHDHASMPDVEIQCDLPADMLVSSDRVALRTVLSNLLHNALKSVGAAGGGRILLEAGTDGRYCRLDVIDDGLGFDPDEAHMLFEEFYRPGDELRRKTEGTGLGLYIVRSFVHQAGGRVKAESAGPGKGARFSVWWPLATAAEATP